MVAKIFCLLALTVLAVLPARADWKITKRASHFGKDEAVTRLEIDLEESETSENARLELAIFDPKKATLRVLDQPAEPRVSLAEMMQQQRALAGVNGGYFDPEYKAVGLLVSRGVIVQPLQKAKLLSGVLSAANGRFLIQRAAKFSAKQKPGEARQCGPFLIEDGKPISGLNATRFARRTFVATLAPDRAAIGDCSSVTLAQLAALLTLPELKIQRALNLDGGSSSGFWFDGKEGVFSIGEQKQVRDFLAIVPK